MPLPVIPRTECWKLAPLYEDRTELRAVVNCVLEGHLGQAVVDDAELSRAARLEIGCYAIFGGDPFVPTARELVKQVRPPLEFVPPESSPWRRLLHDVHGPALADRSMRSFATDDLDPGELIGFARRIPDGFEIKPIGAPEAARLDRDLEPHGMQTFESAEDFAARGLGFCALKHDGVLACVASSYAICTGSIELAIATHPEFRRLGLAQAVSAKLMVHCLERGIVPHWNAANPFSRQLAVKLGYRPAGSCEILLLQD